MKRLVKQTAMLALLAIVAGVMALQAYQNIVEPIDARSTMAGGAPTRAADAVVDAERSYGAPVWRPASIESVAAALDRPLFRASRRPPRPVAAPAVETASTEPPLAEARLKGVVRSDDGGVALITIGDDPTTLRVARGGLLRGWRLVALTADSATFLRGERRAELRIAFHDDASAPAAGARPTNADRIGEAVGSTTRRRAASDREARPDE